MPIRIIKPGVTLTSKGLEDNFDVFKREFEEEMNERMIDKHPEVLNDEEYEDDIIDLFDSE